MNYRRDGNTWRVDVGPFRIEIVPAAKGYRAEEQAKREAPKALAAILRDVVQRSEEP
jgi:hypothetical protein